jgi:hypothetical protein
LVSLGALVLRRSTQDTNNQGEIMKIKDTMPGDIIKLPTNMKCEVVEHYNSGTFTRINNHMKLIALIVIPIALWIIITESIAIYTLQKSEIKYERDTLGAMQHFFMSDRDQAKLDSIVTEMYNNKELPREWERE